MRRVGDDLAEVRMRGIGGGEREMGDDVDEQK